jgi:hypothetical protein
MSDTTTIDFINSVVEPVRAVMPKNTVFVEEHFAYEFRETVPVVTVFGNHALGAYLTVQVAKILGRFPVRMSHSTADAAPLAALAAGLPVPSDDWYDGFQFVGADEIHALAAVFAGGSVEVVKAKGTVRLVP